MQQRQIGVDGPMVGAIGLGTGPITILESRPSMEAAAELLLKAAEIGVTLWDTANAYSQGEADFGYGERMCQAAYAALPAELRERVLIATKGGTVRPDGSWQQDGRPEALRRAIDASLQSLNTVCIDLWQWHWPDQKVLFADSIGAIAEAKAEGKIRYVGLSNVTAEQIDEANRIVPIATVQNRFSFESREPEQDGVLDKCRELQLTFLPYSPLGGMGGAKNVKSEVLSDVAAEVGASPQQVVLAWLLSKYEKMIPIPGVSRLATLEDSAGAADVELSPAQIAQLDAGV
jgi:aryl-alcohol dehydrogenase-like predicted oxidoreductase